jgi:hypothetical protein
VSSPTKHTYEFDGVVEQDYLDDNETALGLNVIEPDPRLILETPEGDLTDPDSNVWVTIRSTNPEGKHDIMCLHRRRVRVTIETID